MRSTVGIRLAACLAATALIAAGCGSDDDSSDPTTAPSTEETTATPDDTSADTTAADDTTPTEDTTVTDDTTATEDTTVTDDTTATEDTTVTDDTEPPEPEEGLPSASGDQEATIMVITDVTEGQIAYSAPETVPAAEVAFADFPNVEVLTCDAEGDANEYLNCQREAVDAEVDAVVIGYSLGGQGGEDLLYDAGIPVLGGGSAISPLSYAFTSGNGSYVGLGAGAASVGCTEQGILHLEGTDELADMVKAGAESQGVTEVSRAAVPSNAPDLAPAIAKLLGDGANCIIMSVSPPMVVQALTAIGQSGETPLAAAISAVLPEQLLEAVGPLTNGVISVESTAGATDDNPAVAELVAAMQELVPDISYNVQAALGFVSSYTLATAISQIDGEVTREAIIEQLDGISDLYLGGIVPPVTIQELDSETVPRYMNPWAVPYIIQDGVPERAADDFVSIKDAIEQNT